MSKLYNSIELLCKEKNINITKMCKELRISRAALSDLKAGRSQTLATSTLQKITNYFDVTVDYLTGNSKYKNLQEAMEYNWGITTDPYFEAPFDFCELLKEIREEQGISIEEMSSELEFDEGYLIDCEDGILPVTYNRAEEFSNYLGTNVSQVLFDNGHYDEEVPEEYHDDVRKWEQLKIAADKETQNPDFNRDITCHTNDSISSDEQLKFALFNGAEGVTDEMFEEVKQFAEMVKLREDNKRKK